MWESVRGTPRWGGEAACVCVDLEAFVTLPAGERGKAGVCICIKAFVTSRSGKGHAFGCMGVESVRGSLFGAVGDVCVCVDVEKCSRLPRRKREETHVCGNWKRTEPSPPPGVGDACVCLVVQQRSCLPRWVREGKHVCVCGKAFLAPPKGGCRTHVFFECRKRSGLLYGRGGDEYVCM